MFGAAPQSVGPSASSVCSALHVPYLSASPAISPSPSPFLVRLGPTQPQLESAVAQLVASEEGLQWDEVAVLVHKETGEDVNELAPTKGGFLNPRADRIGVCTQGWKKGGRQICGSNSPWIYLGRTNKTLHSNPPRHDSSTRARKSLGEGRKFIRQRMNLVFILSKRVSLKFLIGQSLSLRIFLLIPAGRKKTR